MLDRVARREEVVALHNDEVRKLAERTGGATTEIAEVIETIQSEIHGAVTNLESGSNQVSEGVKLAQQVAEALAEINSGARSTLDRVNEIATAANQQGVASAEIARNVERVAQMTEENSAGVATVSGSARELETLSHELLREVSLFKA